MKPIPAYRAAHMLPYITFLRAAGSPVERHLRQARLPVLLAEDPEAKLPLLPTLEFLSRITRDRALMALGYGPESTSSLQKSARPSSGRRTPQGPALALLKIFKNDPEHTVHALHA